MQIQVQSYTQPEIDHQIVDIGPKKSTATETSSIPLIPRVVGVDSGQELTQGHRDNKVAFDFTGEKATSHVLRPNLPSGPIGIEGAYAHIVPCMGPQQQHSPHTLSPSSPQVSQQEQDQPEEQTDPRRHPYSFA